MLEIENLSTFYGKVQALWGVSLSVKEGQITVVIGSNGAGKSTLLKTVSALLKPRTGTIRFKGMDITRVTPDILVEMGITQVPEGRLCFGPLKVVDNLKLGCFKFRRNLSKSSIDARLENIYRLFPVLKERSKQKAQTLSGGEQQMLAVGRALMSEPKLLLLDEPSQGLAPMLVELIFDTLLQLNVKGLTIILVEQNANLALEIAEYGYVLETGRITLADTTHHLRQNKTVQEIYLGKG